MFSPLLLLLIAAVSVSIVAGQTAGVVDCFEPRIDIYAFGSGTTSPGADLGAVVTQQYVFNYNVTLSSPITTTDALVNITIDGQAYANAPNQTNINFTVQLNGNYQRDSTGAVIVFSVPGHPTTSTLAQVGYPGGQAPTGSPLNAYFLGRGTVVGVNTVTVNITQSQGVQGSQDYYYCNLVYIFTITNPMTAPGQGGLVQGDPQFRGLRGQTYQVHGIDGAVYNLISDTDLQVNSRFAFLGGPRSCPLLPSGIKSAACWSHPGSYLGQIGVVFAGHELYIEAGTARHGLEKVTFDGRTMHVNDTNKLATRTSTHELTLTLNEWTIEVENSDMFLNLRAIKITTSSMSQLRAHGLIGQTWKRATYPTALKYIEGDVDDYLILDDSVFGTNFVYNKYQL